MLTKKYGFVLVLLIFTIAALSAVSANDLNATDEVISEEIAIDEELKQTEVNSLNNDEMAIDDELKQTEDDSLSDAMGTFTQLEQDISQGSTVYLKKDYSYSESSDYELNKGITIDKDLTIEGNGHTIYGNSARIFIVEENCEVTISNVNFINTKDYLYSYGGSIFNSGKATFINCTFINSTAAKEGGGIYSEGILVVYECYFTQNEVKNSDNETPTYGGAISSDYSVVAYGTYFLQCSAKYGGAISSTYAGAVIKGVFSGNYADIGGGIYNNGTFFQVNNSGFALNVASLGGALSGCDANHCIFLQEQEQFANYAILGSNMLGGTAYNCSEPVNSNDYFSTIFVLDLSASPLTKYYADSKKFTVKAVNGKTLKSGVPIKIKLTSGSTTKTITAKTNSKGIASFTINLAPKTYKVSIVATGDTYSSETITSKVIVKKGTPKITAAKQTFKVKTKTKKYTITLKNNVGKVMKNTKVKLTVNGKTFTAKTDSKGKATFKITNLKKKTTFKATVKYGGSSYYNAVNKKVSIKVK